MSINRVSAYFANPNIVRVFVFLTKRKPTKPLPRQTNPHRMARMKEAFPANPNQPVSEENPWRAEFELNGNGNAKLTFHVIGLNAMGKVLASLTAPAKKT